MSLFNFSDEDKILIEDCIKKGHKGWYDESLKNLKGRLKEHLRKKQKNVCCYCSRNINGESKMIVDIEHILPKYKHKNHMFTLDNLAASCRRCNFQKGKKVDFLTSSFEKSESPFDTQNYHFIHPNADIYEDHIKYIHVQTGSDLIVFYIITPNSTKGYFSYDYFKLNDFVINSFDKAQGIKTEAETDTEVETEVETKTAKSLFDSINYIKEEIENLGKKYNQK